MAVWRTWGKAKALMGRSPPKASGPFSGTRATMEVSAGPALSFRPCCFTFLISSDPSTGHRLAWAQVERSNVLESQRRSIVVANPKAEGLFTLFRENKLNGCTRSPLVADHRHASLVPPPLRLKATSALPRLAALPFPGGKAHFSPGNGAAGMPLAPLAIYVLSPGLGIAQPLLGRDLWR